MSKDNIAKSLTDGKASPSHWRFYARTRCHEDCRKNANAFPCLLGQVGLSHAPVMITGIAYRASLLLVACVQYQVSQKCSCEHEKVKCYSWIWSVSAYGFELPRSTENHDPDRHRAYWSAALPWVVPQSN